MEKSSYAPADLFSYKIFKQWFSALVVTFGGVGLGLSLSWTATALPSIQHTQQLGHAFLSTPEKSLLGSLLLCGALVSCPITAFAMNAIGRKATLIQLCLLCLPGWLLLWAGNQPGHLYLGRILTGIYAGGCTVVIPVFVKELSSPENRGVLGSTFLVMLCIGKLISNIIGILFSASTASLICSLHPVIYVLLLLLIPESPSNLSKAKLLTAGNNLPDDTNVLQAPLPTNKFVSASFPIFTVFTLTLLAQLCGINVVTFFTNEMFSKNTSASIITPGLALVLLSAFQVIGGFPASIFVDKYGRKVLLLSSFVAMTISMFVLSAYYYYYYLGEGVIVPLVFLTIYCLAYSWGVGSIIWIIMSEIIPIEIIAPISSLANILYWASAFLTTFMYKLYSSLIPLHIWFFAFAVVNIVGIVFVAGFLPETKGLSSEQVERIYQTKKHSTLNETQIKSNCETVTTKI